MQSLLAALGSVQFVSNIAFAYFVLNKMVTVKYVKNLKWELFSRTAAFHGTLLFDVNLNLINVASFTEYWLPQLLLYLETFFLSLLATISHLVCNSLSRHLSLFHSFCPISLFLLHHMFWVISVKDLNINVSRYVSFLQS